MDSSFVVLEGITDTAKTNIVSLRPSSRNCCSEMVAIVRVDPRICRYRISLVLQSMSGLYNSSHGNPKKIGWSGLLIILNDTTHTKLFGTTWIDSHSSTIFLEAMGRPSITTTDARRERFLGIFEELGQNSYPWSKSWLRNLRVLRHVLEEYF